MPHAAMETMAKTRTWAYFIQQAVCVLHLFCPMRLAANTTLLGSELFEGNIYYALSTSLLKIGTKLQSSFHIHIHAHTQSILSNYYSLLLILNKQLDQMLRGKGEITFPPRIPETACHFRPKNCIYPDQKQKPEY